MTVSLIRRSVDRAANPKLLNPKNRLLSLVVHIDFRIRKNPSAKVVLQIFAGLLPLADFCRLCTPHPCTPFAHLCRSESPSDQIDTYPHCDPTVIPINLQMDLRMVATYRHTDGVIYLDQTDTGSEIRRIRIFPAINVAGPHFVEYGTSSQAQQYSES